MFVIYRFVTETIERDKRETTFENCAEYRHVDSWIINKIDFFTLVGWRGQMWVCCVYANRNVHIEMIDARENLIAPNWCDKTRSQFCMANDTDNGIFAIALFALKKKSHEHILAMGCVPEKRFHALLLEFWGECVRLPSKNFYTTQCTDWKWYFSHCYTVSQAWLQARNGSYSRRAQ